MIDDILNVLSAYKITTELHEQGTNSIELTATELPSEIVKELLDAGMKSISASKEGWLIIKA